MTGGRKVRGFGAPKGKAGLGPGTAAVTKDEAGPLVRPAEKKLILVMAIGVAIALSIPHPMTKTILMGGLGIYVTTVFFSDFRLGLCLLPILIPAQNLVPKGLFPIPGLNFETLLMILLLVTHARFKAEFPPPPAARPAPPLVAVSLAFLGWIAASAVLSLGSGEFDAWFLFSTMKNEFVYIVLLFVIADSLRDERDRMRMMVAVTLAIVLTALQPFFRGTELLAAGVSLERHRAVSLLALQPNIYGGALACFLPFPIVYFVRRIGGPRARILFGGAAAMAAYCMVLTLSRGSWVAFAAAAMVVGLLAERRIVLIIAFAAVTSPFWLPADAVNRADTMKVIDVNDPNLKDDEGSAFVRVDQWQSLVPMMLDSPVLGHGYQMFPWVYQRFGEYGAAKGAHVGYAEYAAETGVPGLVLYVSIFLSLGLFGWQLARKGSSEFARAHGVGLLGAAVAMAVAECFGSRLKVGTVTAFLWIYASVAIACWRWPLKDAESASEDVPRGRPLIRSFSARRVR